MTVQETGRRTFFHHRGANSYLDVHHFDFSRTNARLFHFGYLMLLDRLDETDETGLTGAARVLRAAKRAGLETSADTVSVEHPRFRAVVESALPLIDHLIINEVEAGHLLDRHLSQDDCVAIGKAAQDILRASKGQSVVIHTVAGGVVATPAGTFALGSLELPAACCRGANGAGDAFAAGYLYGLHERWLPSDRLRLAICTAAASLSDPTPSEGVRPVADCLALAKHHPNRPWSADVTAPLASDITPDSKAT